MSAVTSDPDLIQLEAEHLRDPLVHSQREVTSLKRLNEKLTHEIAELKRPIFAAKSESYSRERRSLLEETIDADIAEIAGIDGELDKFRGKPADDDERQA